MNKKFLTLSLMFTLGASLDAIRWPWSSRVAPEDVMTMEAIPSRAPASRGARAASSSPLRRKAHVVDGSPQSRLKTEDRVCVDRHTLRASRKSCGKSRLRREVLMTPVKTGLRLGSFAEDTSGMSGAFPGPRRSPVHSARSPRHRQ
jgi:hypothetical protein